MSLYLSNWHNRGVEFVSDLFLDDALKSFSVLQVQFNLLPTDCYKYNQVVHLLRSMNSYHIYLSGDIWRFYTSLFSRTKGISFFYNIFQQKLNFINSRPFQKWESDLGVSISASQWLNALKSTYSMHLSLGNLTKDCPQVVSHALQAV